VVLRVPGQVNVPGLLAPDEASESPICLKFGILARTEIAVDQFVAHVIALQ
jgi:hypothetical protein